MTEIRFSYKIALLFCFELLFNLPFQLEDGHALYDYSVNINDVIQLMERQVLAEKPDNTSTKNLKASKSYEQVRFVFCSYLHIAYTNLHWSYVE